MDESPFVYAWAVFRDGLEDPPTLLDTWPKCVDWFDAELENMGFPVFLFDDTYLSLGDYWTTWMMREGIAPGQKFLLRIEQPRYHVDYFGEWDTDYGDWEILAREPLSDDLAWRVWVGALQDRCIDILPVGS